MIWRDRLVPKLILALGLLRNISCSVAYVLFWYNNGLPHIFDAYCGSYSLWRSFGWVLSGGGDHTVLFLYLCNVDSKERHEAATHTCDSTEESKKAATQWVTAYCGGEGGIRTHGPLRSHWFSRPAP